MKQNPLRIEGFGWTRGGDMENLNAVVGREAVALRSVEEDG